MNKKRADLPKRILWHGRQEEKDRHERLAEEGQASGLRYGGWPYLEPRVPKGSQMSGILVISVALILADEPYRVLTTSWQRPLDGGWTYAAHLMFTWCSIVALHLIVLGPQTDRRQPLAVQLGFVFMVVYQCLVATSRFRFADQPASPQEQVGCLTAALHALLGIALQIPASLGHVAPWTFVRARIGFQGVVGLVCSISLWSWTAGSASAYPPGPASFKVSIITWFSSLGLVALMRPSTRIWIHDRLPSCARQLSVETIDPEDCAGLKASSQDWGQPQSR